MARRNGEAELLRGIAQRRLLQGLDGTPIQPNAWGVLIRHVHAIDTHNAQRALTPRRQARYHTSRRTPWSGRTTPMYGIKWRNADGVQSMEFETELERRCWADKFVADGLHYALLPSEGPRAKQLNRTEAAVSERRDAKRPAGQAWRTKSAPVAAGLLLLLGLTGVVGWPGELLLGSVWTLWMWS